MKDKIYFVRFWSAENDGEIIEIKYYYSAEMILEEMHAWEDKKYDIFSAKCVYDKSQKGEK